MVLSSVFFSFWVLTSRVCLAHKILKLLENGHGELGVFCVFVWVKKAIDGIKGKEVPLLFFWVF